MKKTGLLIYVVGILLTAIALFSCASKVQQTDDQPTEWRWVGIGGGGSIFTPAISPHDPNFAFTSCDMGGSMVTYDGGESWRIFNLGSVARYFVFDPVYPNVVYAHSIGLFKSEDKGRTWNLIVPNPAEVTDKISKFDHADEYFVTKDSLRRSVRSMAVDPTQPKQLYAAIQVEQDMGLYSSIDGGQSWKKEKAFEELSGPEIPFPLGRVVNDYEHDIKNIFVDPSSPADQRTLYATCRYGVYQRINGLWKYYKAPGKGIQFNFFAGGYDASSKKFILYGISGKDYFNRNNETQTGIFYSEDGGKTWENRQDGLLRFCAPDKRTAEYRYIACSAYHPGTLYVSYNGLRIHADTVCLGVAKSTDFGKTWTLPWQDKGGGREEGITTPNFKGSWLEKRFGPGWVGNPHAIAVSATNPDVCYRTDAGRIIKTENGGKTWEEVYSKQLPDGSWTTRGVEVTTNYSIVFDPHDKNNVFITVTDIGLVRSTNGGKGWLSATENNGVPNRWVNTAYWLIFDPEVKGRVWSVMSLNHDIPRSKMWAKRKVSAYEGGVLLSNDSGETWKVVSQSIGEAAMTHILLDPTSKKEARTLYACAFGKGVYKSTDGGLTWVQKNNGLEGAEPFAWRIERRENDGTLFLVVIRRSDDGSIGDAMDGALYRSSDGAESWTKLTLPKGCNGPTDIVTTKKYPKQLVMSAWGRVLPGDLSSDEGGGIYVSDDDGKTWMQVMDSDQHIYAVTYDLRTNRYYACGFNGAAYYSEDGAYTWTPISGYDFKWGHRVIPDPYNPEMVYINTFGGGVWYGPVKCKKKYPDFKLAVTHAKLRLGTKEANLEALKQLIDETVTGCKNEADGKGPDMILLSELVYSRGNKADQQMEETDGPLMKAMAEKAKEHQCYIVYNFYESRTSDGKRYNTNKMVNRKGEVVGSYDKVFATRDDFNNGCVAGSRDESNLKPIETEFGPIGMLICYDVSNREGYRDNDLILLHAERGARLVLISTIGDYSTESRNGAIAAGIWTAISGQDSYRNDNLYKTNITDPNGNCVAGVVKEETGLRTYCSAVINLSP